MLYFCTKVARWNYLLLTVFNEDQPSQPNKKSSLNRLPSFHYPQSSKLGRESEKCPKRVAEPLYTSKIGKKYISPYFSTSYSRSISLEVPFWRILLGMILFFLIAGTSSGFTPRVVTDISLVGLGSCSRTGRVFGFRAAQSNISPLLPSALPYFL
jgi:hypothetical protein